MSGVRQGGRPLSRITLGAAGGSLRDAVYFGMGLNREWGNVMFMWLGNENVSASRKVDRQEAYFIRLQHIGSDWHVVHLARNNVAYANEEMRRHMLCHQTPLPRCHWHMRSAM